MSAPGTDMVWLIAAANAREINAVGHPHLRFWLGSVTVTASDAQRLDRLIADGYLELEENSSQVVPTRAGQEVLR